jgi:hypothetical protein
MVRVIQPTLTGKNGHILGGFDFLEDLVKIEFAESVHAGTDQDDVLVSFNAIDAIQRVVERIE